MTEAPQISQIPDELKLALESFFFGLDFRERSVTLEECLHELQTAASRCDFSEEELETVIARFAIERGFSVDFDRGGRILNPDLSVRVVASPQQGVRAKR